MKKYLISSCFVLFVAVLFIPQLAIGATIDFVVVFSDNRQYSGAFPIGGSSFWGPVDENGNGAIRHFIVAGAEILRAPGDPVPVVELSDGTAVVLAQDPYDLFFWGSISGLQDGLSNAFISSPYGPHGVPDDWEGNQYTFTLYSDETKQTVLDTAEVDAASTNYRTLDTPVATMSTGSDPFHPTITWPAVENATNYRVVVMNVNCKDGMPAMNNPLHISEILTTPGYTIPADVTLFYSGRSFAIWVQAREIVDGAMINRSSYFAKYSSYRDGGAIDDLQAGNGWSEYKSPAGAAITFSAQANQLDISATTSAEGDDFFAKWQKPVEGLRGIMATFNVSAASGTGYVGLRRHVAKLNNGNLLRAELRLYFVNGDNYLGYRVREMQSETWNETFRYAEGRLGMAWDPGNDITLGIKLVHDTIYFFAVGIPGLCGPWGIPVYSGYEPLSDKAELATGIWRNTGVTENSSVTAQAMDVKLLLAEHIPDLGNNFDINGDGKTGLEEAIHALQIIVGAP